MRVVILAGGQGSRLSEETYARPKPMVQIGGKPILWHIMKIYSSYGLNDFIICCGHKGHIIKEYFTNFFLYNSDVTIDLESNLTDYHRTPVENWRVTIVDTGETTQTGGRIKRIRKYLSDDEPFCMTYGDGLSNVDISRQIEFHRTHGKQATITAVPSPGRYGALELENTRVQRFAEKSQDGKSYINGGFFVLHPSVIDRIEGDMTPWEHDPLETLAKDDQLQAFFHEGFWAAMDTPRDKVHLDELWDSGVAPWKLWDA
jgi:glucose-1-phosphate cytidylyltransferase